MPPSLLLPERPPTKEEIRLRGWKDTHEVLARHPPSNADLRDEYRRLHLKGLGLSQYEKGRLRALADEIRRRGQSSGS